MTKDTAKQVFLWTDWLILGILVAAGVLVAVLGGSWTAFGVCWIACVLAFSPFLRHGYKLEGQTGVFRLEEVLVPRECQTQIIAFLNGDTDELSVQPAVHGGALVRLFRRKSDGTTLAQYFDYAQYLAGTEYPFVPVSAQQAKAVRALQSKQ
ncbi:MAG: hypothetical protein SPL42_01985 [Bacteroidales bacterium]|nr:hypothetical protein [Bacteroidales bacterium]MDY6347191.1 hypothetical protein [Bacteroidales bacterium]